MNIEIDSKPSYGMAVVTLDKGEKIICESGAMAAMSAGMNTDSQISGAGKGGLIEWLQAALFALARKWLAGESVFVNHFKAKEDGQQVFISPALVGDVINIEMDGQKKIIVQSGSYLASTPKVVLSLVWGGFSMLFGGEGAFFLKCSGTGNLLLNTYGAIEEVEIDGKYNVDNGHVVAWEDGLKYSMKRPGGWKATLLSGEGMVIQFNGKGKVWLQTRDLGAFVRWISPYFGA